MTENNTAVPLEIKLNIIPKTTEQNQAPANQKKPWFFVNMWNKVKSYWAVEEEEYIDGHGFRHKRPKKKNTIKRSKFSSKNRIKI